jgi:hypothetical protein
MDETGVPFPVIMKPDVGEQGWGVALICTRRGMERYFECMQVAIIVQRYVPGIEVGIFHRHRAQWRPVGIDPDLRPGCKLGPCLRDAFLPVARRVRDRGGEPRAWYSTGPPARAGQIDGDEDLASGFGKAPAQSRADVPGQVTET